MSTLSSFPQKPEKRERLCMAQLCILCKNPPPLCNEEKIKFCTKKCCILY